MCLELEKQLMTERQEEESLSGYYARVTSILERLRRIEQRFDGMEERVTRLKMQVLKR